MKKIPELDITKHYQTEFDLAKGSNSYRVYLNELIKKIENEKNPMDFKEQLLAITQLYFDSTFDSTSYACFLIEQNPDEWNTQSEVLDKLILAGKNAIGSFYSGDGIDLDSVKEIILPYADSIIKYGPEASIPKVRHLRGLYQNVQTFGIELQKTFDYTKPIDTLVCIASGAFEPSFLAMNIKEKEDLVVMRYSVAGRDDKHVKVPNGASERYLKSKIEDKTVLVVEDVVCEGGTLAEVMKYSSGFRPDELYGISVKGYCRKLPKIDIELLSAEQPFIYRYNQKLD